MNNNKLWGFFLNPLFFFILIAFFLVPTISAEKFAYNYLDNYETSTTTGGSGNVTTFLNLSDTPADYTGDGGDCVKVNVGETGLEFVACGGGGDFSFTDFQASFDLNATGLEFNFNQSDYDTFGS